MRYETLFDTSSELIIVEARIWGPKRDMPVRLVLDTGSAATLVVPDTLDALGYSPRDGTVITTVTSAIGKEQGYVLHLAQFEALGFTVSDFPIHVFDLADRHQIDGLIGLNFLQKFNYEIRSAEGRILVEELAL